MCFSTSSLRSLLPPDRCAIVMIRSQHEDPRQFLIQGENLIEFIPEFKCGRYFLQGHFYSYLESFIDLSCISKARNRYKRNVMFQKKKKSCISSLAGGKLLFKTYDCFVFLHPEWTVSHESVHMSCTFRSSIHLIVLHHLDVLFISTCFSVTETCFA